MLISIVIVGVLLVAFGVLYKVRSQNKEQYLARAQASGIDPAQLDTLYRVYRDNRLFVGSIAVWTGISIIIVAIFAWYEGRGARPAPQVDTKPVTPYQ